MARSFAGGTDTIHWTIAQNQPDIGCLAFWMKTTQVTANSVPMSYWGSDSRNGFGFILNNTANKLLVTGYGATLQRFALLSTTSVNDGNPHHIAFNYNKTLNQLGLYIDGVLEPSGTASGGWGASPNSPNWLMQSGDNLDPFWASYVGEIWDVGHWNGGTLTADQIASLAKGYSPKLIAPNALMIYAPLVRDTHDVRFGSAVTATGGSVSPHGRIIGGSV